MVTDFWGEPVESLLELRGSFASGDEGGIRRTNYHESFQTVDHDRSSFREHEIVSTIYDGSGADDHVSIRIGFSRTP